MGAVQASDYALPEFRMLWRLLLVHGRWNYIRISEMIMYFFYKNMLFTIPQFITAFFCAYSGQTLFDNMYVALYNLIFTAAPVVVRAVLEQDVTYMFKEKQTTA
jgi:phospholipid-transporting ATPase